MEVSKVNVRNYMIAVILIAALLIAMVWSTTADASRVNATAGIAVAAATVLLAIVTYFGIRASQLQARDAQYASARPILVPVGMTTRDEIWQDAYRDLDIRNVGAGVALNVSGVILPPLKESLGVPPQLSMQSTTPIAPYTTATVRFHHGGTMFVVNDHIAGIQMGVPQAIAPEKGFPSPYNRRYRAEARLTLTYTDVFSRKHVAIYDLDTMDHWASVAILEDIPADIDDMDADKAPNPPVDSSESLEE